MQTVVGLGSNLGARENYLRAAVHALQKQENVSVRALSSIYETEPVGGPPQPNYLNAAALIDFAEPYTPTQIVQNLLEIELKLGRQRFEKFGPRTIDLDLLWADCAPISSEVVTVPHPRLCERAFALLPLVEVMPYARHVDGQLYTEIIAKAKWVNTKIRSFQFRLL